MEPAEEGGFIAICEDPVTNQGEANQEVLKNIKEAIEGYLEAKTHAI